ncbi:MAG: class I SAM-dependent methyltransferase [Caldilineaceae bacterium]
MYQVTTPPTEQVGNSAGSYPRLYPMAEVQAIYDKAYTTPGLMGTHLDGEYSRVTKSTLLAMCQPASNGRLLDLGTGDGDLWTFAETTLEWHAIDISHVGVARAHSRFPRLHPAVAIGEYLPYPDQFFDAVVAADTMEHVFDLEQSLREIRRVLAPGGKFALSVPAPQSLRKWATNRLLRQRPEPALLWRLLRTVVKRRLLFGKAAFQPIDRDLSLSHWRALLQQQEFQVQQTKLWPVAPLEPIVYLLETTVASS